MKHKVVFLDLDGTLITVSHGISKSNILALEKFVKNGGDVVLSTGRSIVSALKIAKQITKKINYEFKWIIASNGGYIYDVENDVFYDSNIPNETCWEILRYAKYHKTWMLAYTDEATRDKFVYATFISFWPILKIFKSLNVKKIRDHTELASYKIVLCSYTKKRMNKTYTWLKEKYKNELNICRTNKRMIEVNAKNIDKGTAIKQVLLRMNLKPEQAIAMGDSPNDIPGFKVVDLPIAINSDYDEVINNAKCSIPYFKNAVAVALNKFVFEKEDVK